MQKFFGKKHNKEQSSNEIIKDNNNITPNSNNEQMVNENEPNNFDDQPVLRIRFYMVRLFFLQLMLFEVNLNLLLE